MTATVFIPMRLQSPNKTRYQNRWVASKQVKATRNRVAMYMRAALIRDKFTPDERKRLTIHMTRVYGGRAKPMDSDNLRGSLKALRDGVAAELGIDDASPAQWPEPIQYRIASPGMPHEQGVCIHFELVEAA